MQVTINIGYDQVLELVRQLSPDGRERILREFGGEIKTQNTEVQKSIVQNRQEALRLALACPVATPEEIDDYYEFRRQFRCRPT